MTSVKKLYGGAIHAYLPTDSCDISEVRQVPDNQEVFAHSDSDQSIIFDILEYIPDVDDLKAIEQHFLALVGEKTEHEIVSVSKMDLNLAQCDGIFYLHGRSKVSKYREHAKNLIDMHLALFRYKSHATDILITFNDPILINPESSSYSMKEETEGTRKWTLDDFKKTVQTFTVIDFSLFAA